jgi:hypothetical protein
MAETWASVTLDIIFTKEQRKELKNFLIGKKGTDPMELTEELKTLFRKWEKDLLEKGILPDYLAYAITYQLSRVGYDRMIFELSKKKLDEVV